MWFVCGQETQEKGEKGGLIWVRNTKMLDFLGKMVITMQRGESKI